MRRVKLLGFTAIILWLTNLVLLLPLPPVEVAQIIQEYQNYLAVPPQSLPNWNERTEWEQKRVEEQWQINEKEFRQNIAEANELEFAIWVKWCARLTLIAIAIVGWLMFTLNKLRWKIILPATTLLLVTGYAIFNPALYSEFFPLLWRQGKMLFGYGPWVLVIYPFLNYYVVPTLLAGITIAAFVGKDNHNGADQSNDAI